VQTSAATAKVPLHCALRGSSERATKSFLGVLHHQRTPLHQEHAELLTSHATHKPGELFGLVFLLRRQRIVFTLVPRTTAPALEALPERVFLTIAIVVTSFGKPRLISSSFLTNTLVGFESFRVSDDRSFSLMLSGGTKSAKLFHATSNIDRSLLNAASL
jgi:hypothetical protein